MHQQNELNQDCNIHKKICRYFCQYNKCLNRILCEKCVREHIAIHPKQFIYPIQNLSELHSFNKLDKLREILVSDKANQQQKITDLYERFMTVCDPLKNKVKNFKQNSQKLLVTQLYTYLSKNKYIIQNTKVQKSNTDAIENNPIQMLSETVAEVQVINKKQLDLKQNSEHYTWYFSATQQLCDSLYKQLTSMISVAIKVIDTYSKVQEQRYSRNGGATLDHHDESFYKRYINSHKVARHKEDNDLELSIMTNKKEMLRKEGQLISTQNQVKQKVKKIEQHQTKISILRQQLIQWEQKAEREEKKRKEHEGRLRKSKQQQLIKDGVITQNGRRISMEKKNVDQKLFPLILQFVPQPQYLDLSNHYLNQQQLESFLKCTTLVKLKMNFTKCNEVFLFAALDSFKNLTELQLNSAEINDQNLGRLAKHFPSKIKKIQLMGNNITDQGIQTMFINFHNTLDSFYISYNYLLTSRSIQILSKYTPQLRVLHIAKSPIKSKGGVLIGSFLKNLQELFIGGIGIQKDGLLAILRGCKRLKKLSLVSTQLSTQVLFQFVNIQSLQWLDISYCLNKSELQKIEKIKMLNKNLQIVY